MILDDRTKKDIVEVILDGKVKPKTISPDGSFDWNSTIAKEHPLEFITCCEKASEEI